MTGSEILLGAVALLTLVLAPRWLGRSRRSSPPSAPPDEPRDADFETLVSGGFETVLGGLPVKAVLDEKLIAVSLAKSAIHDPDPEIRRKSLQALAENCPNHPKCAEALDRSLSSEFPELRLTAARLSVDSPSQDEPLPAWSREVTTLRELAEDQAIPVPIRLEALELLNRRDWVSKAGPVCRRLLMSENPEIREAAVEGVERLWVRAAVPDLLEALLGARWPYTRRLAEALRQLTHGRDWDRVQDRLIELLSDSDKTASQAAIEALGEVGDHRAVAPLRELAGSSTGRFIAAKRAVERILERIGGVVGGEMALVEDQEMAGALSPTEEVAGRGALSEVEPETDPARPEKT